MTVQIYDLETIQLGIEATRGTLVAATHVVDFEDATLKIDRSKIRTARSGSLATGHRSDNGIVDYEITIRTVGTFDRMACFLPIFLSGATTTGSGGSADKTWVFTPSDVADNLKSASLEVGGNDSWPTDFLFAGCVGRSMKAEIQGELWKVTWTFGAMKKTNGTKTGSLAAPAASLVDIVGWSTKVYLDATTIHTTLLSNEALKASFSLDLATKARHYLGSSTGEAGDMRQLGRRKVAWDITGDWLSTTELLAWEADTLRRVSIDAVGPVLGGSNYEARFDFVGSNEVWEPTNVDGGVAQHVTGIGKYDATLGADMKATIVNSIAAIP